MLGLSALKGEGTCKAVGGGVSPQGWTAWLHWQEPESFLETWGTSSGYQGRRADEGSQQRDLLV